VILEQNVEQDSASHGGGKIHQTPMRSASNQHNHNNNRKASHSDGATHIRNELHDCSQSIRLVGQSNLLPKTIHRHHIGGVENLVRNDFKEKTSGETQDKTRN